MNNNSYKKFTKILVPIDGSAGSMKAAEYGADIAQIYGGEIVALHVLGDENSAGHFSHETLFYALQLYASIC